MKRPSFYARNWYAGVLSKALWDIDNELWEIEAMEHDAPCEREVFTGGLVERVRFDERGRLHNRLYVLDTRCWAGTARPMLRLETQPLNKGFVIPPARIELDHLNYRLSVEQMKREDSYLVWKFYLSLEEPALIFRKRSNSRVYFNSDTFGDMPNLQKAALSLYNHANVQPLPTPSAIL